MNDVIWGQMRVSALWLTAAYSGVRQCHVQTTSHIWQILPVTKQSFSSLVLKIIYCWLCYDLPSHALVQHMHSVWQETCTFFINLTQCRLYLAFIGLALDQSLWYNLFLLFYFCQLRLMIYIVCFMKLHNLTVFRCTPNRDGNILALLDVLCQTQMQLLIFSSNVTNAFGILWLSLLPVSFVSV